MTEKKITAWSYSRYSAYSKCPRFAKFKFIDKLPEPTSPASARGIAIHKLAEDYVLGKLKKLPAELKLFGTYFQEVRTYAKEKGVEENWAFTKAFGSLVGWFEHNVWCRVKADLWFKVPLEAATEEPPMMYIIDHKTGKVRNEEYEDQLELSAVAGFEVHKEVKIIETQNWYLDHGPENNNAAVFTRDMLPKLEAKWVRKVRPMLTDTKFPPRPGNHCRWCYQARSKGGKCEFG